MPRAATHATLKVDPPSRSRTPRPPCTLPAHGPLPEWNRGARLRPGDLGQRTAFLFPFLNVMLSFCRNVLHSRAAEDAIYLALNDYFPGEMATFLKHNLALRGRLEYTSMLLLLFTANGIFEPLEVALNHAWGV